MASCQRWMILPAVFQTGSEVVRVHVESFVCSMIERKCRACSRCSSTEEQCSREPYLHISPGSELCLQFLAGGRAGQSLGNWPELRGKQTQNTHVSAFSPALTAFSPQFSSEK